MVPSLVVVYPPSATLDPANSNPSNAGKAFCVLLPTISLPTPSFLLPPEVPSDVITVNGLSTTVCGYPVCRANASGVYSPLKLS